MLQGLKNFSCGSDGKIRIRICVAQPCESRLVLRGSQIHAVLQHGPMEPPEFRGIAFLGIRERPNGSLHKKESKHAADVASAHVVTRLPIGPKKRHMAGKVESEGG